MENPGQFRQFQDETAAGLPDGIDKNESHRWQLEAYVPEPIFNEWVDDCLSSGKEITASELRRKAVDIKRQTLREELADQGSDISSNHRWNVYQSDLSTWKSDRQYDFIITDPPYPKEYLPLYETLSERASSE